MRDVTFAKTGQQKQCAANAAKYKQKTENMAAQNFVEIEGRH
jgi:hypothetical protein